MAGNVVKGAVFDDEETASEAEGECGDLGSSTASEAEDLDLASIPSGKREGKIKARVLESPAGEKTRRLKSEPQVSAGTSGGRTRQFGSESQVSGKSGPQKSGIKLESQISESPSDAEERVVELEPQEQESSGQHKRKVEPETFKVQWTDESDSVPTRPKKRRAKRKSTKREALSLQANEPTREDGGDLLSESGVVPDDIVERRQRFNARKKVYHEAALMLPPDYTGIGFDDTGSLEELQERPQFDPRSGIKPSRPYFDIELPQSGGLIPASIAQYLRDYQVEGVRFLHKLFVYQLGGVLGDDMGLGKTIQVIGFLTAAFGKTGDERDDKRMRQMRYLEKANKRWYPQILIICPGSLIMNWRSELNRWGWWHIDIYHGAGKDDILTTARAGLNEIVITTYDTYKTARSAINMVAWDAVIADECHRLKDPYSQTARALMEVNALCRIGLTGTAIQNKYEELWTLLDWTNPGHFGTSSEWSHTITRPLTVGQSHDATRAQLSLARTTARKLVQNLLPRYFLRRMKTLIAHQLPKKTDRVVFCHLTEVQREAYRTFLQSADIDILRTASDRCHHGQAKGWCCGQYLLDGTRWQTIVFPSMVALQKLANHLTLLVPQTTAMDEKHRSALKTLKACMPDSWKPLYENRDRISNLANPEHCGKWKVLKKLLKFWHGNGDKVLVFSHSVRLLRILQHLFTNTSYTVTYLDGSMSYEARQEAVDGFNSDPSQFVFLISTKAGGVGLNITSANKVVIVDPHWNPAYDLQAQDRAYRIGQQRDVEVFRLISVGTVEEIVYARQIYKQQQANIGYTASSERRYFRGVQQDTQRQGEIFGLKNIFSWHSDMGLLRDIVNKTNIAEAKAGVHLVDVDMDRAARESGEDNATALAPVKIEEDADGEDGGLSQLASILTSKDPGEALLSMSKRAKNKQPRTNAVQAILKAAGVDYTHENSEVVGSSRVEEQLSRQAEMALLGEDAHLHGQTTLFGRDRDDDDDDGDDDGGGGGREGVLHGAYNPPGEVCLRQFCEMAREFGFGDATEFALIVEGWTQEERRNCLDTFYRRREALLDQQAGVGMEREGGQQAAGEADAQAKEEVECKTEDNGPHNTQGKDVKGVIKREGLEKEKQEIGRREEVEKQETQMEEQEVGEKEEEKEGEKKKFKMDGTSQRTSIFLSDSDEDDEL